MPLAGSRWARRRGARRAPAPWPGVRREVQALPLLSHPGTGCRRQGAGSRRPARWGGAPSTLHLRNLGASRATVTAATGCSAGPPARAGSCRSPPPCPQPTWPPPPPSTVSREDPLPWLSAGSGRLSRELREAVAATMADGAGSNGDAAGLPVGKEAVERLIRENGHIFTEAQCKVCSALLISESQRLAHYQSKKHANKVRRYLSIHGGEERGPGKKMKLDAKQDSKQEGSNGEDRNKCCPICNMTFSSPAVATSHYLGKTHAKNMKQQSPRLEEAVPPLKHPAALPTSTASSNEENKDITDPDKFCSLCHATFNNPLMAKQHYVGKKHRKQETKHKLMAHYGRTPDAPASSFMAGKGYPCSTCNIVLNSIEQYQAHISGFKHKNQMPGAVSVVGPFQPQQYVREESTAPGGYSYFSQDF